VKRGPFNNPYQRPDEVGVLGVSDPGSKCSGKEEEKQKEAECIDEKKKSEKSKGGTLEAVGVSDMTPRRNTRYGRSQSHEGGNAESEHLSDESENGASRLVGRLAGRKWFRLHFPSRIGAENG